MMEHEKTLTGRCINPSKRVFGFVVIKLQPILPKNGYPHVTTNLQNGMLVIEHLHGSGFPQILTALTRPCGHNLFHFAHSGSVDHVYIPSLDFPHE